MTEPQPERDPLEIVNLTADTLGRDLLSMLLDEFRGMKKGWEQYSNFEQQAVIDRLKSRVRLLITEGLYVLFRGQYPACPATIDSIQIKQGLQVRLKIAKGARSWHEVIDAEGAQVLIVMADPEAFAERMDEVRAQADQKDLFTGDYKGEPEKYRRDQDAPPIDKSWQDLIDSLEDKVEPQPGDLAFGAAAEEPAPPVKSMAEQVQGFLAAVHVYVEIQVCEAWSEQECTVAAYWAIEYAKNPDTAPARPHWLPMPDPSQAATAAGPVEGATDDSGPELSEDNAADATADQEAADDFDVHDPSEREPPSETADDENDETAPA